MSKEILKLFKSEPVIVFPIVGAIGFPSESRKAYEWC